MYAAVLKGEKKPVNADAIKQPALDVQFDQALGVGVVLKGAPKGNQNAKGKGRGAGHSGYADGNEEHGQMLKKVLATSEKDGRKLKTHELSEADDLNSKAQSEKLSPAEKARAKALHAKAFS